MSENQLETLAQVGKRPWDDWDAGLIWRVMDERKRMLAALREVMAGGGAGYAEWKSTARAAIDYAEEGAF